MEIVQVYSDHGRSGLNIAGREGLNQLMSDVENKQANFSALLVYDTELRSKGHRKTLLS
jgi:DNA invertase Pin-like site-specific DNA recombinase